MFSSRAPNPTKRAVRALLIPPHHSQTLQRRHYAASIRNTKGQPFRAPSTLKKNRTTSNPTTHHRPLFQKSDVPPLKLWQEFLSHPQQRQYRCLSAVECRDVALRFATVARGPKESPAWKGALLRDHNIDPRTLYCAAIPLVAPNGPTRDIGTYMLMTASSLGYTPATLSLIRIILDAPDERFVRLKTDLGDAVVRFLQLVRTERSPDVLTLRGLWLLREGHSDVYALKYFDQALEAAARSIPPDCGGTVHHQQQQGTTASSSSSSSSAREPRWTFEGSCHLKRGLILARQGRTEEAIASFKIVALELDLADGYAELANLLPPDAPEREGYLLRAAQAGHVEACRLLALDMAEKAVDRGLPWSDRRDAAGLAHEWSQVVTDPKRREELAVEVAEKAREVLARAQGGLLWKLTGWTTGKGV